MRNIRHIINHRCNELLKYDNNNYKPCTIHFDKWHPYDNEGRVWILKALETSDEDWSIKYMYNIAKIKFCPFCGEKLTPPLIPIESEQN